MKRGRGRPKVQSKPAPVEQLDKRSGVRNHRGYRMGEWHQRSKYSDELVRQVKAAHIPYARGYTTVGGMFGLPWETVRDMVTGRIRASS